MVYTVSLQNASYKQNISDIDIMLDDQQSSYFILKYAKDIPDVLYNDAMEALVERIYDITYTKLYTLVYDYLLNKDN